MTNLNKEKFKPLFGTWWPKIESFFDKGGFDPIYEYLKFESKRGKRIAPNSDLVYRCFKDTDINNLKCVLLGYCPYHSFYNNSPVADGLAFSCGFTNKLQPSLEAFYRGLELDLHDGLNLNYYKNPDLSYLSEQGVLLWNSSLTVEKDKAGSHQKIWSEFTKFILEDVLVYTGIPIVFIGRDAQVFNKSVTPLTHGHIFNIEHPAFAARNQSDWDTQGVFTAINKIIRENNGKEFEIQWLDEKCPF